MQGHSISRPLLREELLRKRLALSAPERARADALLCERVEALVREHQPRVVAGFWPIRGEPDLRSLWPGWPSVALPVVAGRDAKLRFARWTAEARLSVDAYGIPVPDASEWVEPDLIILPCLGFFQGSDGRLYRLGYGRGHYDRTLAEMRVATLGVSYAQGRIEALTPLGHDVPLDALVTEDERY